MTEEPQATKTKLDLFRERLETYPDLETAKLHIKEIADDLGVSKSLGYKALRQITKWEETPIPKAAEPVVRIPEEKIELPTPEAEEVTAPPSEAPTPEAPTAEVTAEAPPTEALQPTEIMVKLRPIMERSIGRLFNNAIEMASGVKQALSTQESEDTAILLPYIIWRITKVTLNEDQFIDATCITHFGSIVVKVINEKLKQRREEEAKKKAEAPAPAPAPTPKAEPVKPVEEQKPEEKPRPQTASFMKNL